MNILRIFFVHQKERMKKEHICTFLYTVSLFLVIGFAIRVGADYLKYDDANNSAPFYAFILERAIEFLVPSIVVFIIAKGMKKKCSK